MVDSKMKVVRHGKYPVNSFSLVFLRLTIFPGGFWGCKPLAQCHLIGILTEGTFYYSFDPWHSAFFVGF